MSTNAISQNARQAENEPDQRMIDDILGYFIEKKRLLNKQYLHIEAEAAYEYLKEAAALCKQFELHPAKYVDILYERMAKHKHFFKLSCLAGKEVKKYLTDELNNIDAYKVEITNATLDYADVWRQQENLANAYTRRGEPIESVLADATIKFFGWFRILFTPQRDPEIVHRYKKIARKELNSALKAYIISKNLDLSRIVD
jgi:hypothetical protein